MENLKKFTEQFFRNLGCALTWQDQILKIENVPQEFEKALEKKSPYQIVFDAQYSKDETELIAKGSYLLKTMMSYLDTRGQTTLLKIVFDLDASREILKHLNLKNCTIANLSKKQNYTSMLRFTFLTTFQYLNKKDHLNHEIYTLDGNIINFSIKGYNTLEGKKDDAQLKDLELSYKKAKEHLKLITKNKIEELSVFLQEKLEKENQRVKEHYNQQQKEIEEELAKCHLQLEESKKEQGTELKQEKLKERIKELQDENKKDKLRKEEAFFLQDEEYKHSLNISTKLVNTSIIYYPIFNFSGFLKDSETARMIELTYNPITKNLSDVYCDNCKKILKEIFLCSSGHIACSSCLERCGDCGKQSCKKCLLRKCETCNRQLCRKCTSKCLGCGKVRCSNHMKIDYLTGKEMCESCLTRCTSCSQYTSKTKIKKDAKGKAVCEKCLRLESLQKHLSND